MRSSSLRPYIGGLAVAAALIVVPGPAQASVPTYQERIDVKKFARFFWAERGDGTLCYGVRIRFRAVRQNIIAYVPQNRTGTTKCVIVFNRRIDWGRNRNWGRADPWWRFCQTAIHEYGHLPGMPFEFPPIHSRNPSSIMASSEEERAEAWWWPFFPGCRYDGDDEDGDGEPDW